ncbi:MAG TPA: 2-aminoethylphosphonate aminotransferase [Candidatus Omnitrophota bacterium]|nr:2-aminoethylphosphonate aminotransferase [Candidatus Omnitrophota bacterium]HRZ15304.1 2-aminoethylphosphonate aminotransferase [Candidatus Omnitrophota bacterium]
MTNRLVLLNPGPVNLTSRVRKALILPDMCHREPDFARVQADIRKRLLKVYGLPAQRYSAVVLTGSGTAAVEAMIASFVPASGKLLILANGVYGERMSKMAQAYGIAHFTMQYAWGAQIPLAEVESVLRTDAMITHVAVIHHETTTGRLNDLAGIGSLCRKYRKIFLVDAVSSFGGEDMEFQKWGIAACAASSNKCLHGVPGAAFVIARKELFAQPGLAGPRSFYLDLAGYFREQEADSSPFTHAVQVFLAFQEALKEYRQQGGVKARIALYRRRAAVIRKYAQSIGLKEYLSGGSLSSILTAFYLPEGLTYARVHDRLRARGFVIYAGQGNLSRSIFRIANMGAISDEDIRRLFCVLKELVCRR